MDSVTASASPDHRLVHETLEPARRPAWPRIAIVVIACTGVAAMAVWFASRQAPLLRAPMLEERFANDQWRSRWANVGEGSWHEVHGRMVSTGDYASYLLLHQRLTPPLTIEYTAQISTGARPGDLSVRWFENDPLVGESASYQAFERQPGWMIQAGAFENSACSIFRVPENNRVANSNRRLEVGKDYRFRIELGTDTLQLWIDGDLVLDHRDLLPLNSGYLALYGYYPGKSFTDLRVWLPELPDLISPLALGDADYRAGRFRDAAVSYEQVAAARPTTPMADDGLFRASLAYRQAGDRRMAIGARARIHDPGLRQRAECLSLDDLADSGRIDAATASFTAMWNERPAVRDELRRRWQAIAGHVHGRSGGRASVESVADRQRWYDLRENLFPKDENSAWMAARMLLDLGQYTQIISRFPDERRPMAYALLATGKARELLAADWSTSSERVLAYLATGELEAALRSPAMHRDMRAVVLCHLGHFFDAARLAPYPALIYQGRTAEYLRTPGVIPAFANQALIADGRLQEAAGDGVHTIPGSGHDPVAMIMLGQLDAAAASGFDVSYHRLCAALVAGDLEAATRLRPLTTVLPDPLAQQSWFGSTIGLALADVTLGDQQALRHALEHGLTSDGRWGGRYLAIATAVLAEPGTPSELHLEWTLELPAWNIVVQALRAELAGDGPAALEAWRRFTTLPRAQRMLDGTGPNLELEYSARWRIAELMRTSIP